MQRKNRPTKRRPKDRNRIFQHLHKSLTTVSAGRSATGAFEPPIFKRQEHDVNTDLKCTVNTLFSPRAINIEIGHSNIIPKASILDKPIAKIQLPVKGNILSILDDLNNAKVIDLPENPHNVEKLAVRMIVIRRKKMKKHKLKKLRKKMKFKWAKIRQARELRKEKAFHAELIALVRDAEDFSAEKYVADKIYNFHHEEIPNYWKGKRLPRFIVRQLMGIDKKINYKGY